MNDEILPEEWISVISLGGRYEVSTAGRIRNAETLKIRKMRLNATGYYRFNAWSGGKLRSLNVHLLVAEGFLGPRPAENIINHKDGIKTNNAASNLEWVTRFGNSRHARNLGLYKGGERNGRAKIREEDAALIIQSRGKISNAQLARRFGITPTTVSNIQKGRIWSSKTSFIRLNRPRPISPSTVAS